MNLAHGYIAQTLQTHDELVAARVNEQRRMAADRRALEGERADGRSGLLHRVNDRLHGRGGHVARDSGGIHGARVAH